MMLVSMLTATFAQSKYNFGTGSNNIHEIDKVKFSVGKDGKGVISIKPVGEDNWVVVENAKGLKAEMDQEGDQKLQDKITAEEREALVALYKALNGENWYDQYKWCTDAPITDWENLYFDYDKNGLLYLDWINLACANNISGVIPRDLEKLSSLRKLCISSSSLDGLEEAVPEWIGNMSNLHVLSLVGFSQESELPESFQKLKKVNEISIVSSHLTSVSDNIYEELPLLTKLDLQYNQLTKLPESIGLALNRYFESEEYKDLPIWWGTCFEGNRLSGKLPESLTSSPYWGKAWPQIIYQQWPGYEIDLQGIDLPALGYKYYDTHDNLINYADVYKQNDYTLVFDFCNAYGSGVNYLEKLYPIYQANKDKGFEVLITSEDGNIPIKPDWKLMNLLDGRNMAWITYSWDRPMVDLVDKNGNIILTNRRIWLKDDTRTNRSLEDIYQFLIDTYGAPELYASTDYSADGNIVTLHSATEGNGIDIVLMGDAFTDQMIADGTYDREMRHAMDVLFSDPLMAANKKYFNVKYVTAVSKNGLYLEGAETAFKVEASETNTKIVGDHTRVVEYARMAVGDKSLDNCEVLVIANKKTANGTCYMLLPDSPTDYGSGLSICYATTGFDEYESRVIALHEAIGHGLGKLNDEYSYYEGYPEEFTEEKKEGLVAMFGWGFYKNIDLTSDPSKVKWSKFINDSRYADENIGVYEGGAVTPVGVYRPTEQSIMNNHWESDQFNAPSREAIWYRIHKIAFGADWQYNYEDFVTEDLALKRSGTRATTADKKADNADKTKKLQHSQPVFINKTWRDLLK